MTRRRHDDTFQRRRRQLAEYAERLAAQDFPSQAEREAAARELAGSNRSAQDELPLQGAA